MVIVGIYLGMVLSEISSGFGTKEREEPRITLRLGPEYASE